MLEPTNKPTNENSDHHSSKTSVTTGSNQFIFGIDDRMLDKTFSDDLLCEVCNAPIIGECVATAGWSGKPKTTLKLMHLVCYQTFNRASTVMVTAYVHRAKPQPTTKDRHYAKQYWKLRNAALLLSHEIEYAYTTIGSVAYGYDESGEYHDLEEWTYEDVDELVHDDCVKVNQMIRLANYALSRMDNPALLPTFKPARFGDNVSFDQLWKPYNNRGGE